MTYTDLIRLFYYCDAQRVERDDRLVDVFEHEDREKGVELWELWDKKVVKLFRVRLPFNVKKFEVYILPKDKVEQLLLDNEKTKLQKFGPLFQGVEAISYLRRLV